MYTATIYICIHTICTVTVILCVLVPNRMRRQWSLFERGSWGRTSVRGDVPNGAERKRPAGCQESQKIRLKCDSVCVCVCVCVWIFLMSPYDTTVHKYIRHESVVVRTSVGGDKCPSGAEWCERLLDDRSWEGKRWRRNWPLTNYQHVLTTPIHNTRTSATDERLCYNGIYRRASSVCTYSVYSIPH